MRAGELRHVINIERRAMAFDDLGHEQQAWKVIARNVRARVEELAGRELERAKQLVAESTHRVTIRIPQDVKTSDRIVYRGRVIEIRSRSENELGTLCDLLCVEEIAK
jgi:SPP1 family predicted phage head-tail adaptor